MPPGPIPDPNARRRNAPTISTTALPSSGRKGRAPGVPKPYRLLPAGRAWWTAAWKRPQAVAWELGSFIDTVARRAILEDDLAAVPRSDTRLRLAVMREMRELDTVLGLNPKGLATLRWSIVDLEPEIANPVEDELDKKRRARLDRAIEPDEDSKPAKKAPAKKKTPAKKAPNAAERKAARIAALEEKRAKAAAGK